MAVNKEERQRRKKRKIIDQNRRKLLPDDRVELRSLEEGFLGSWHSATVIRCDNLVREVRYDHLLRDDGGGNLTECVNVTPIIDGVDASDAATLNDFRGLIRPLPPSVQFERWSLHYGQCVDMHFEDAWWEGVVFDHKDGSKERDIFFPDMGDEMKAHVESLRITQDWDEMTEKWKPRGKWLFLELVEEIEPELSLVVSVKQIWYDMRLKKGYDDLKEWTSPVRESWRKLVLQVLSDNLKLGVKEIVHNLNSFGDLVQEGQPLLKLSESSLDVVLNPESFFGNSMVMVSFGIADELNSDKVTDSSFPSHQESMESPPDLTVVPANLDQLSDTPRNKRGRGLSTSTSQTCNRKLKRLPSNKVTDSSVLSHQETMELPPDLTVVLANPDQLSDIPRNKRGRGLSTSSAQTCNGKLKRLPRRGRLEWHPAGSDMVPEPEFCPDAIIKYCKESKDKRPTKQLALNARKHLSYLGWKIETAFDNNIIRVRYISPEGKYYFSLLQICRELEPITEIQSPIDQENQRSPTLNPLDNDQRSLLPVTQDCDRSSFLAEEVCVSSSSVKAKPKRSWKRKKIKSRSHSRDVSFESEHNPQAVKDYLNGLKGNIGLKVKKHLASVGWSFSFCHKNTKNGINKEMRYHAPSGKIFYSLMTACEWYDKEGGVMPDDVHASVERQVINVSDYPKCLLSIKGPSSPAIDLKFPESSTCQGSDLSEKLQQESSSGMLLSREHIKKGKTKLRGVKQRRKKKTKCLSVIACHSLQSNDQDVDSQDANSLTRVRGLSKRARQGVSPSANQTPRTVLSWLIDNDVVLPRAKVQYRGGKDGLVMAEGRITRDGIKCCCCQNVFTLTNFEVHAGSIKKKPAANIFLEDGRSLFDCQLKLKNIKKLKTMVSEPSQTKSNRHNRKSDYICSVCHDGGELLLCDQCPSAFHASCLGMKDIPDGDWFCPSCCCGICGHSRFGENPGQLTDSRVVSCSQCEHKFHFGCLRKKDLVHSNNYPVGDWFCNEKCQQISQGLRKLLGKPIPIGIDGLTWTVLKFIKPKDCDQDDLFDDSMLETYSKLSVALSVMHECFEPVKEPRTRRDIVEDVIFSRRSELNRLNFQGFYTVLLERNDELITAATVRVYGEKVAEMPLVGTRFQYRQLGMCRILMNELEKKLLELGVERLVLPAVPSVLNTWINSFGFSKINEAERLNFRSYTFLDFHGTVMCEKLLKETHSSILTQSIGPQQNSVGYTEETRNMELDGNSAVCQVHQGDQLDESKLDDRGSKEAGGLSRIPENVSPALAIEENEEAQKSCEGVLKCYKRRRVSAY